MPGRAQGRRVWEDSCCCNMGHTEKPLRNLPRMRLSVGGSCPIRSCWKRFFPPLPLQVAYAPGGKPFIRQVPWHYNLSHSGDYVALAVSDVPVGIDIQQMLPYKESLVKRFFAQEEAAVFESGVSVNNLERELTEGSSPGTALFYRLWCRKEAYGKLKGTGLTEDVLKRNMLKDTGMRLYEYGEIPGYYVCVCCEEEGRRYEMPNEAGGQELR